MAQQPTRRRSTQPATIVSLGFLRRYVFVASHDMLWDLTARQFIRSRAAFNQHRNEFPADCEHSLDVLFRGPDAVRKVDAVTYRPGANVVVEEHGAQKLNLWAPTALDPVPGDVAPFLDLAAHVLDGDEVATNFVLDYFAHLVQHPGIKIASAILIIGKPGIGKSLIGRVLTELVGVHNAVRVGPREFAANFNEWIEANRAANFTRSSRLLAGRCSLSSGTGVSKRILATLPAKVSYHFMRSSGAGYWTLAMMSGLAGFTLTCEVSKMIAAPFPFAPYPRHIESLPSVSPGSCLDMQKM